MGIIVVITEFEQVICPNTMNERRTRKTAGYTMLYNNCGDDGGGGSGDGTGTGGVGDGTGTTPPGDTSTTYDEYIKQQTGGGGSMPGNYSPITVIGDCNTPPPDNPPPPPPPPPPPDNPPPPDGSGGSTDVTRPVITAFSIPSSSTSVTVSITTFTATDDVGVTGFMVTETSAAPLSSSTGWSTTAPPSHTFETIGTKALYAWAKDAAGNVSAGVGASVNISEDPGCSLTTPFTAGTSAFTNGITVPTAGSNTVVIASPASGAAIDKSRVIVKGAIDPNLKGAQIMVETRRPGTEGTDSSFLSHINGAYFAALAPLQSGENNIKALAKDTNGVQRDATVTVNATPGTETLLLTYLTPNADVPTLKADGSTTLEVTLQAIANIPKPVAKYSWDFNGDGVPDLQCKSLSTVTASYQNKGIYLPTVTVTDTDGKTYTDTTIVAGSGFVMLYLVRVM